MVVVVGGGRATRRPYFMRSYSFCRARDSRAAGRAPRESLIVFFRSVRARQTSRSVLYIFPPRGHLVPLPFRSDVQSPASLYSITGLNKRRSPASAHPFTRNAKQLFHKHFRESTGPRPGSPDERIWRPGPWWTVVLGKKCVSSLNLNVILCWQESRIFR